MANSFDFDKLLERAKASGLLPDGFEEIVQQARDSGKMDELVERAYTTAGDADIVANKIIDILSQQSIPIAGSALGIAMATFLAGIEVKSGKGEMSKQLLYSSVESLYPVLEKIIRKRKLEN